MTLDLISGFYEHGIAPTAALICTTLYIQQMVREKTNDRERASKTKSDDEKYTRTIEILSKITDSQQLLHDGVRSLTLNSITLAELLKGLGEDHENMMDLTNTLVQDLKILAVNQVNLMNSFQKVIEQLITALKSS